MDEPYNLKKWKTTVCHDKEALFYTCARPGRSQSKDGNIEDETVSIWAKRLPELTGPKIVVVSLLGRKKNKSGPSEFSYYTFCGGWDTGEERKGKPTFQEWLDNNHGEIGILVSEHPTYDYLPTDPLVPQSTLDSIREDICAFINQGRTVVVVDSFGEGRTGSVKDYLQAKEAC